MISWQRASALGVAAVLVMTILACGREERGAVRVVQARANHEVRPTGFQPRRGADGTAALALDLLVVNRGRDRLRSLTLLVVVVGRDGTDRASRRVTVDTSQLIPGVSSQLSAVVPGLEVGEGETVLVELENDVPESDLDQFPEFAEGIS